VGGGVTTDSVAGRIILAGLVIDVLEAAGGSERRSQNTPPPTTTPITISEATSAFLRRPVPAALPTTGRTAVVAALPPLGVVIASSTCMTSAAV
jgi:hypothetical protein